MVRNTDIVKNPKEAIVSYWGKRSHDFSLLRKEELKSNKAERWKKEILPYISADRNIKILDVGTGSGFFSILLAEEGYRNVTGIDLTPKMIEEAKRTVSCMKNRPLFEVMDAEKLDFASGFFDVIITRNLTWTLMDMQKAYAEWYRVLRQGGILLNFDASYGEEKESEEELPAEHAHKTMSAILVHEHEEISRCLPGNTMRRPAMDVQILKEVGFRRISIDFELSERIYQEIDEFYNPVKMFYLRTVK